MAFPEDTPDRYGAPPQTGPGPVTQWDSNALFAFAMVAISGVILLLENGIVLALLPLILTLLPSEGLTILPGLIIMVIFIPVALVQLFAGYRMYNRTPGNLGFAKLVSIVIIVLTFILLVTEIATGAIPSLQLVIIQIGVNIVFLYLSTMRVVQDHFEGQTSSYHQGY